MGFNANVRKAVFETIQRADEHGSATVHRNRDILVVVKMSNGYSVDGYVYETHKAVSCVVKRFLFNKQIHSQEVI